MSYANSVDLTLYKLEEFHPHGYLVFQPSILYCSYMLHIKQPANHKCCATNIVQDECTEKSIRIIGEIYYCPVHYPKFCRIVYPQYRFQYLCTASLNSPTNLLSNGELLKPNYRVSIDHVTCGSVLTVSNVTDAFSVWLNFNFCTSLNLFYLSLVGIVGNAYIDLTKEERQYVRKNKEIRENSSEQHLCSNIISKRLPEVMGEDIIVMVVWGRIWKKGAEMEFGEQDFSQIAVYKGIRQASWIKKHVIVTVNGNIFNLRKSAFNVACAVSDIYANRGRLKIAFILAINKANEVRRMNNGAFNAMTDEEDH
ncbi:conserved hypothetical protein [Trichinella spiralis]|uniref:hypothetical protein n=1 Tax=Trichinella spiralis TaxID=6334 RepID=UPI0001EFC719|nr:conserved hypothetical protein [Trichinella spiralis]